MKKSILIGLGTRPEAIKLIPLFFSLKECGYDIKMCSTGQHNELLEKVFNFFKVRARFRFRFNEKSSVT